MQYQNKRNKTKKKIDDAFIELYREKDISHITVREICSLSQINRSTFYTFYDDVYDLRKSVEDGCINDVKGMFSESFGDSDKDFDVSEMISALLKYCAEQDDLPVLMVRRSSEDLIERMTDTVKDILVSKLGDLGEEDMRTISFCMKYHIAGMAAMFTAWENQRPKRPVSEAIEIMGNIANEGVANIFWGRIGIRHQ